MNDLKSEIRAIVEDTTFNAYICKRVWSAWSYGTMGEDDFQKFSESDVFEELVEDIEKLVAEESDGWISVDVELPKEATNLLVACEGGNVARTFFSPHWENFQDRFKKGYGRKTFGKNSRYFELCWEYGYKIMYWKYLPEAPKDCLN